MTRGERLLICVGTRPEIIKMAPIIKTLELENSDYAIVHSGQHYSYNLSQRFFEQLDLPSPEWNLEAHGTDNAQRLGDMVMKFAALFKKEEPSLVLVEGDTDSVLAACLASNKVGITLAHVEAGPRSFDFRMPEEYNRRLADHLSDYLFAPSLSARTTLLKEGVGGQIFMTGNTVIDATMMYMPLAESSPIRERIRWKEFALATLHRSENVDNPRVLKELILALTKCPVPVVLPLHPRTRLRLRQSHLTRLLTDAANVQVMGPVSYLEFLKLMKTSSFVLTDSGGVQEECTSPAINKTVVILRDHTESPECILSGYALLAGVKANGIVKAAERVMVDPPIHMSPPYGKGHAARKIFRVLRSHLRRTGEATKPLRGLRS